VQKSRKSKGEKISMTNQKIKDALMNYHRVPKLISEELEIIRNCEAEREEFSPRSAQVSGLPHSISVSDRTYSDAMDGSKYFDKEIKFHRENIIRLQEQQRWFRDAMQTLTAVERDVIEKTFVSPDGR
jgi:ABC-type dipeptide/oligopeptide/nickel transport system ATPase component